MTTRVSSIFHAASRRFRQAPLPFSPNPTSHSPRILILSASVGAGHVRAAQSIQYVLGQTLPHANIAHVDVLQLTNSAFRKIYSDGYFKAAARTPHLVRKLYESLDRPNARALRDQIRLCFEYANFTRLTHLLHAQPWDLVIHTHFLSAGLMSSLRRRGTLTAPMATVITDFDAHGLWIHQPCDRYFVATAETRAVVQAAGVSPEKISITGIPIDPLFANQLNPSELYAKYALISGQPTILQMAGGFGVGPVESIFRSITNISFPLNIFVVTGNNKAVKARLGSLPPHPHHNIKIVGFTREVDELMAISDLVVSKPGGLTTSESLARGCAMAVVDPIPGQEERNTDFLLERGCAVKVSNLATLTYKLENLLSDPSRLSRMRSYALYEGKPYAAFDVARGCVDLLTASMASK